MVVVVPALTWHDRGRSVTSPADRDRLWRILAPMQTVHEHVHFWNHEVVGGIIVLELTNTI